MEYMQVTKDNIEKEHICCAISNNKDIKVSSKKDWMMKCFDDGLVFWKSVERGKCFIEYIPAENAWVPVIAENYMYIDCFWVAGSFKGNGYSNDLLNRCIEDSKAIHIETKEQAQAVPSPCTSYAMFYNGEFLTNEQFNDKKFLKRINDILSR